jgi:hypothetical protein
LKGPQDEINQRRSKGLHELNTRRIRAEKGAFDDVEKTRKEAVRPDGVIEYNKGYEADFDDNKKQMDIAGQLKFLEDARGEIENFGPGPALLGQQGISNRSGRAIAMLQQAGLAELGPYIIAHTSWKQRVYESVFHAVKKYWTNERWIRLTDEEGQQQFVQINAMQMGPYGMPQIVNQLGELDVDIVLDEGPDSVTMMEDLYETLSQIVPAIAPMLKPPEVQALIGLLIETSPLTSQAKSTFRKASEQANQVDPLQKRLAELGVEAGAAEVDETKSKAILNMAKAQKSLMPEQPQSIEMPKFELPPQVQVEKAYADIEKTRADALHKATLAGVEHDYARLEPFDYVQRAREAEHKRAYDIADLHLRKYEAESARQQPRAQ